MPIHSISLAAARDNHRSGIARWPKRGIGSNRIEPVASPGFKPTFGIAGGSTVFTIGSCFARNVEVALERRGFVVPARRFLIDGSFSPDAELLNNYSVPAIFNEIAWAFGEIPFDAGASFSEIKPGLYADIHLVGRLPLESLEAVALRRQRIFEMTRSLLTADVMILTLGLAEVWKDKHADCYLNTFPREAKSRDGGEATRYELHVLSCSEVQDFLNRIFEIVFRRCRPQLRAILTISPVPMAATFTDADVCVANTYSKAVLRTAAEAVVRDHSRIDYFPSYESVMLSDRALAWEDDQIHVRPALIEHNVKRMIEAYTGETDNDVQPALETVRSMPSAAENEALHALQQLYKEGKLNAVIVAALPLTRSHHATIAAMALRVQAMAHLRLGDLAPAETAARSSIEMKPNHGGLHGTLGEVLLKSNRVEEAEESLLRAAKYLPQEPRWASLHAQALARLCRLAEAREVIANALTLDPANSMLLRTKASLEGHGENQI